MSSEREEASEVEAALRRPSHRRLREFEFFDDIHLHIVERWKDSHISGAEWRFSIHADFSFKGHLLFTLRFMNMDHALATIAGKHDSMDSGYGDRDGNDVSSEILKIEKDLCDQPGCKERAVHKFRLERIYSKCGTFSNCLLYTSPSPRDQRGSRMPSSA